MVFFSDDVVFEQARRERKMLVIMDINFSYLYYICCA